MAALTERALVRAEAKNEGKHISRTYKAVQVTEPGKLEVVERAIVERAFGQVNGFGKRDNMKSKPSKNNNGSAKSSPELILREQIEKRAHEIWLSAGCPHGDDLSHWLQAEREALKGRGEGFRGERRQLLPE